MSDTRVSQTAALVDDGRTLLREIAQERDLPEHLQSALFALNVAVSHLEIHRRLTSPDQPA